MLASGYLLYVTLINNSLVFLVMVTSTAIDPVWKMKLAVFVSDKVPEIVIGDPGRFRQIITNLVGNSVKVSGFFLCAFPNLK